MRLDNEWIETDGRGGSCSGTVAGNVHRLCHGLWLPGPAGESHPRKLLSGFSLYFRHPEAIVPLTSYWLCGRWNTPDAWPNFESWPAPAWTWEFDGGAALRMELMMARAGAPGLAIRMHFTPSEERPGLRLFLHPLLPWSTPGDVRSRHATGFPDETGGNPLWLLSSGPFNITRDGELLGEIPLSASATGQNVYTEPLFGGPRIHLEPPADRPLLLLLTPEEGEQLPGGLAESLNAELDRRRTLPAPPVAPPHQGIAPRLALALDRHRPALTRGMWTAWREDMPPPAQDQPAPPPPATPGIRTLLLAMPALWPSSTHAAEALHVLARLRGELEAAPPANRDADAECWWADRVCLYAGDGLSEEDWHFLATHLDAMAGDPLAPPEGTCWSTSHGVPLPEEGAPLDLLALRAGALSAGARQARARQDEETARRWSEAATRAAATLNQRTAALLAASPEPESTPELPFALAGFLMQENPLEDAQRSLLLHAIAEKYLTPRGILLPSPGGPDPFEAYPVLLPAFLRGLGQDNPDIAALHPYAHTVIKDLLYHFEQEGCVDQVPARFAPRRPQKPRGGLASIESLSALAACLEISIPAG